MPAAATPTTSKAGPVKSRGRRRFAELQPREEQVVLHGHRVSYRVAGDEGPVVVLIHGIAGCAEQWDQVMPLLAERYTVVAPDLLGHGRSDKPRGDYSLGAFAASVRDLLVVLGHRRATIVGHSLGGGVAMQFTYEYPPFAERLVLVSSGGLGREVHPLLRAATLPGSELVLPLIANESLQGLGGAVGQLLGRVGLRAGPDLAEMAKGYASLADAGARQAFIHSLRAVLDITGQRVSATDRLYLAALLPSLIIWGSRDPLIPVEHATTAHRSLPGSRLEVFEDIGHFPQIHSPVRFAQTLIDFIETTDPTQLEFTDADFNRMRQLLRGENKKRARSRTTGAVTRVAARGGTAAEA
ncbi:MAG TPA: alpha/beta hydrolase [Solirubrobacteraceae bacterium]|nr:alpha/beta hydrolase [Solirubrobacteraceae bacterium]